jgi:hypothetical protein
MGRTKGGLADGDGVFWIHVIFLGSGRTPMRPVDPLCCRLDAVLEHRQLAHGVGVRLRAILHRRGDEIQLRHQLLLGGVDARSVPMEQIEAGAELMDRSLRARRRLTHGLEDELRLRRRFRWRRGEILANPSKPTPGFTRFE